MVKVSFLEDGTVEDNQIAFVVVMARYQNKWIMVRHNERSTWELPGGRREHKEDVRNAAARELFEETGARKFMLYPVSLYSVRGMGPETYGYIFYAEVSELSLLPNFEIAEISLVGSLPKHLAYPAIQPYIYKVVEDFDISKAKVKGRLYSFES